MPELPEFNDLMRDLTDVVDPPPDQNLQLPADVHAALQFMPDAAEFITKAVRESHSYLTWYQQLAAPEQHRVRQTLKAWRGGRFYETPENHENNEPEDCTEG